MIKKMIYIHTACDVIRFIYESDFELYRRTSSHIMHSYIRKYHLRSVANLHLFYHTSVLYVIPLSIFALPE